MPSFQSWLENFLKDKSEVASLTLSDQAAVHSVRRFVNGRGQVWEIAITYTDRLVVRTGEIKSGGVAIKWGEWITQHDVEVGGKLTAQRKNDEQS